MTTPITAGITAVKVNLTAQAKADLRLRFAINRAGEPFDISGSVARFVVGADRKASGDALLLLSSSGTGPQLVVGPDDGDGPITNAVDLHLTGAQLAALPAKCVWDLYLDLQGSDTIRPFEGNLKIEPAAD